MTKATISCIIQVVWGDQLHKETRGSTTIEYIYGIDGVIGFIYSQTPYYYIKNLFGDVTKIANTQNEIVAEYLYDAWGNHTITLDTNGIGSINPIRYRSYQVLLYGYPKRRKGIPRLFRSEY